MPKAAAGESQLTARRDVSVFAEIVLQVPEDMTDEEVGGLMQDYLFDAPPGLVLVDTSIHDVQG
jgi:hypothetical protein